MKTTKSRRPIVSMTILSLCLLVLGLNGFIGGYLMLDDPDGEPMGIPVTHLEDTPFVDFTIPGVLLIVIWGFGSLVTLFGLWQHTETPILSSLMRWTHEHWAWGFSVLMGLGLIVWLTVQVFTLPEMAPPQYILYVFSVLMIGLPLIPAMRRYYRIS